MVHPEKPSTVECTDWEPDLSDKRRRRCRYYLPSGTGETDRGFCALSARFTCSEWDRRFAAARGYPVGPAARGGHVGPHPPAGAVGVGVDAAPVNGAPDFSEAPPAGNLLAEPFHLPPSAKARQNANGAAAASYALKPTVPEPPKLGGGKRRLPVADPNAVVEGPSPDFSRPTEVRGLEASGAEVEFAVDGVHVYPPRQLVLVGTKTGRTDRHELTYSDLAALRWVIDTFAGARVTTIRFPEKVNGSIDVGFGGGVKAGVHRVHDGFQRLAEMNARLASVLPADPALPYVRPRPVLPPPEYRPPNGCAIDPYGWERIVETGRVNNCAIDAGEEELLCQICGGECPDRD